MIDRSFTTFDEAWVTKTYLLMIELSLSGVKRLMRKREYWWWSWSGEWWSLSSREVFESGWERSKECVDERFYVSILMRFLVTRNQDFHSHIRVLCHQCQWFWVSLRHNSYLGDSLLREFRYASWFELHTLTDRSGNRYHRFSVIIENLQSIPC